MTDRREIPMLFSAEMVRALLAGRKTQTRRPISPDPGDEFTSPAECSYYHPVVVRRGQEEPGPAVYGFSSEDAGWIAPCAPGDVIWVRENFRMVNGGYVPGVEFTADGKQAFPEFGDLDKLPKDWKNTTKIRPSIHMPRGACRLFLRVVSVRAERVQSMTIGDAVAEGAFNTVAALAGWYEKLWDSMYADKYPWSSNPWVWRIEFQKTKGGDR